MMEVKGGLLPSGRTTPLGHTLFPFFGPAPDRTFVLILYHRSSWFENHPLFLSEADRQLTSRAAKACSVHTPALRSSQDSDLRVPFGSRAEFATGSWGNKGTWTWYSVSLSKVISKAIVRESSKNCAGAHTGQISGLTDGTRSKSSRIMAGDRRLTHDMTGSEGA